MDHNALIAEARLADLRRELEHMAKRIDKMRSAYRSDASNALSLCSASLRGVARDGKPCEDPAPVPNGDVGL